MSGIDEIKQRVTECQEKMKGSKDYLAQLKEARDKILNDITVAQSSIDTYNGALQAFDLCLKAMEPTASAVPEVTQ